MEERRHAPRLHAYHPIRLQRPGVGRVIETLTKDLSLGGFRCLSPVAFPVSTELNIEVVLSSDGAPLNARGRMVWFRTIPESEQFDFGIGFIDLTPQHKRQLSAYISRRSRQLAAV